MLHVIIDRAHNTVMVSEVGTETEIKNDFMNFIHGMHTEKPEMFKIFVDVFSDYTKRLLEEIENDKNNSSN